MTATRPLLRQFAVAAALLCWGLAPDALRPKEAESLRLAGKNSADLDRMEAGYYEHLIDSGRRLDGQSLAAAPAAPPPFKATDLARLVGDFRECVLEPSFTTIFQQARWTTNALGLRDREYDARKPEGTCRAVLIGDSIGVGWGVHDGEGFEPRLEQALDARSESLGGPRIEILNLCVPGYSPAQRREHLERLGWSLDPDLVIVQATAADLDWDARRLRRLLSAGYGWEIPIYRDAINAAGLEPGASAASIKQGLEGQQFRILSDVYRAIGEDCRRRGVPVVWVLLPRVGRSLDATERESLVQLAGASGFDPVLDLSDAFDGLDPAALAIGPDDYHPNAEGHAILARRLEEALADRPGAPWTQPSRPGSAGGAAR
jgi:lysophospholipase L1-like esterase